MSFGGELDEIEVAGGRIEYRLYPSPDPALSGPPLVFLHEGLGSARLWRSFIDDLRERLEWPLALAYSRHGYGWSQPAQKPRGLGFLESEAFDVLPKLLTALGVDNPVLIGHSDGATIALLHASANHRIAGVVAIAPHVLVERVTIAGIESAIASASSSGLLERLGRHHRDPDGVLSFWSDAWLDPASRSWTMSGELHSVTTPVLVVQGTDDPYGTTDQARSIKDGVSGPCESLVLEGVGHAPHWEASENVCDAIVNFIRGSCRAPAHPT